MREVGEVGEVGGVGEVGEVGEVRGGRGRVVYNRIPRIHKEVLLDPPNLTTSTTVSTCSLVRFATSSWMLSCPPFVLFLSARSSHCNGADEEAGSTDTSWSGSIQIKLVLFIFCYAFVLCCYIFVSVFVLFCLVALLSPYQITEHEICDR